MRARHRVVVTGMGAVTPLGPDLSSTWRALLAGAGGIRRIHGFDATPFPVTFAAELPFPLPPGDPKRVVTRLAAEEALRQSGLEGGPDVGVFMGSEAARPPLPLLARRLRTREGATAAEVEAGAPWTPADDVARLLGAGGPRVTISTACTSSGQAVGEALLHLRRGTLRAAVTGGVDILVDPLMITGFSLLGALSTRNDDPERASRPFDQDRDGFVLGDGAGMLVLETLEAARARGAPILAEILGYGCSLNAWRITDSPPDGRGAAAAMDVALRDAGIQPTDLDYINAHGTSTMQNDASESTAIRAVLGAEVDRVRVSSTKGATGHLVAACGAVEILFSILAVRDGVVPHTRNLEHPDPACALRHVMGEPEPVRVRHALSNAFGFGGSNASVVVGAPP